MILPLLASLVSWRQKTEGANVLITCSRDWSLELTPLQLTLSSLKFFWKLRFLLNARLFLGLFIDLASWLGDTDTGSGLKKETQPRCMLVHR